MKSLHYQRVMHLHTFKWQHSHECKFTVLSVLVTQNLPRREKEEENRKVKLLPVSFLAECKCQIRRVKDRSHERAAEEKQV